jgi:hypothetical protein
MTMSSGLSSPILPPELERQNSEFCALSLPVFIPTLMLVAKRVTEWYALSLPKIEDRLPIIVIQG